MTALLIIAGIIILFALLLSIRAHIHVKYEDEVTAYASWAFIKIPLIPRPEKPPKEKKKKEPKAQKPPEETTPAEPKPKGPNPLKTLYENEKIEGILQILRNLLGVIDKFGRRLVNAFVIDEMFLDISVSSGDAAQTAENYGKMCRRVFPVMGAVCANCNVKKYSIDIDPDYIGSGYNEYAFSMEISLNPRKLINAVLLFAFGAVFKVGIRLIKSMTKKNTPAAENENAPVQQTPDGGEQTQGTVTVPEIYDETNTLNNNQESGA